MGAHAAFFHGESAFRAIGGRAGFLLGLTAGFGGFASLDGVVALDEEVLHELRDPAGFIPVVQDADEGDPVSDAAPRGWVPEVVR